MIIRVSNPQPTVTIQEAGKYKGDTGKGITSIALISTVGLVKTYRITFSDATVFDYTVTDGAVGQNGANGTNGTNGVNGDDGADGVGIVSIEKTDTQELTDTYTITFSDNTTWDFYVVNGADGDDANVTKTNVETALSITADETPVDTDEVLTLRSGSWLKTTWANIIVFLKGIFQQKTLYFSNKSVLTTDFVADTTYADYGYKAVISCANVTSTMLSEVTFAPVEADSGNYAAVCLSGTGTVTIYAKSVPSGTITIPTIKSETV